MSLKAVKPYRRGLLEYNNDRVNPPAYDTFAISNYVKVLFNCGRFTRGDDAKAFHCKTMRHPREYVHM